MPGLVNRVAAVTWIAAILCLALVLHGCGGGGSPTGTTVTVTLTTTTSTTTTTTLRWQNFSGMSCNTAQAVKAAYDCGDEGPISIARCMARCENLTHCEGVSIADSGDRHCHLIRNIVPAWCDNHTDTSTFIFSQRLGYSPTNATTAWSLNAEDVVKKANELYNSDDDGVLIHMLDEGNPWQANGSFGDHSSFCIINKAVVSNGKIMVYRDGSQTSILGTPTARRDMLKCFFPCDGYSDARLFQGCGKQHGSGQSCDSEEHIADWCGPDGNVTGQPYDNKYDPHGLGWPCAFRPSDLAVGLKRQYEYKNGATGLLHQVCTWQHPPEASHNEAVIDGFLWNAALPNNVWAFPITSACDAGCQAQTKMWQHQFNATYGRLLPLVRVDLYNITHPFSVFHSLDAEELGSFIVT